MSLGIHAIVFTIFMIGFVLAFAIGNRLKNHVSMEKVCEVKDPKLLFPKSIPPKFVLNERGLFLYKLYKIGNIVIIAAVIFWFILAFVDSRNSSNQDRSESRSGHESNSN
jgi:Fe2+ transport system protein B